jgi:hypothetical protein
MKGATTVIDIMDAHLQSSLLKEAVTGDVYKMQRPQNSDLEDIVIHCLALDNDVLQKGILVVNIHVQDVDTGAQGMQPAFGRLTELEELALADLEDVWTDTYNFDVQQPSILKDDNGNSHFINIRIEFYLENL